MMLDKDISSHEQMRAKYLVLIDNAILQRRYSLAIQLANRCLTKYYQLFLKSVQPKNRWATLGRKNTYQMALRLIRYIRKYPHRKTWFHKQESQYNLVSASYYINLYNSMKQESDYPKLDRAVAVYARNHSLAIVHHIIKYLYVKKE